MTDYEDALTDAADLDLTTALAPPDQVDPHPERLVWLDSHDDDGNPHPWAQLDEETDRQYVYLQYYWSLPMAKRSNVAVARHYGVSEQYIHTLSSKFNWKARTSAWDAERTRIYQLEVFDELREMSRRHGPILKDSIEAIAIPLQVMAEKMRADPEGVMEELGEKNLTQLHAMAIKSARALPNMMQTERLVRGLPTEITENIHSGKVEHVHTPNLDEVREILQGLHDAGAIQLDGGPVIDIGPESETEDESVYQDYADAETDGLPPPQ